MYIHIYIYTHLYIYTYVYIHRDEPYVYAPIINDRADTGAWQLVLQYVAVQTLVRRGSCFPKKPFISAKEPYISAISRIFQRKNFMFMHLLWTTGQTLVRGGS